MANVENPGAAGAPKNPRGGAPKAGRAAAAGFRSFEARARQAADSARAAEAAADKTAEAGRAAVNANTEIVQTHLASGREPMRSGRDAWVRTFEGLTQSWTGALGVAGQNPDLAGQAANVHAVSQASNILAKGVQDAWRAWFELTQRSLRTNLEAMSELANCRSAQEVITVQSNLLRSNLQQAIGSGENIARASSDAFGEATRAMRARPQAAATVGRAS